MKILMIAALVAAQLSAAGPASAAALPNEEAPARQARFEESLELDRGYRQALAAEPASSHAVAAAEEDRPRKKRKSTGDKVLTGAAVILGVGALAVGGLLVAIFVN